MSLDAVEKFFPNLKYMQIYQAEFLRDLIVRHRLDNLLELGTYRGKGTAYMALIQEARGRGHVTTLDLNKCMKFVPNVGKVLSTLGVAHRATIRLTDRSFTYTLMTMLEETPRPLFDFAYLDGAHTWDGAGFTFFLVNMMLRPGGWIVFDDLNWTIEKSDNLRKNPAFAKDFYPDYGAEERRLPLVRKVWELLVPEAGYINRREHGGWGIAQKPPAGALRKLLASR
jgi:predicted O-methyltransferase YrrM